MLLDISHCAGDGFSLSRCSKTSLTPAPTALVSEPAIVLYWFELIRRCKPDHAFTPSYVSEWPHKVPAPLDSRRPATYAGRSITPLRQA